jgi:hypothetical protein
MISKRYALAAVMLAAGTPCYAQACRAALRQLTLSPNTEVVVAPNDTLVTKSVKVGDKFRISTVFDVMQDGYVLIPRGTPGEATITYRTGGAFGKSGKMEVSFNWLDLNGRHIPLSGTYRQEGQGNTGAAVGAVVAVGVFGAFVTGHSASLVSGQQLRAHTVESLAFNVPVGAVAIQTASLAPPAPVAVAAHTVPVAAPANAAPTAPADPIPAAVPATGVTTEGGTLTKPTPAAS